MQPNIPDCMFGFKKKKEMRGKEEKRMKWK